MFNLERLERDSALVMTSNFNSIFPMCFFCFLWTLQWNYTHVRFFLDRIINDQ